ncbi:MAG: excinuclease ABC subunit UvrC [Planctomycetia bacterium]|nr:excinuclease ABC subunit UvrC [Planctomycetia bacterium]
MSAELEEIVRNYRRAAEKVRTFPKKPGVYLMKDGAERVIYIGKAKNLRNRAGSYFHHGALEDPRTAPIVNEIRDIDFIEAESEVEAILMEARLIKDIQPKFNRDLKDDKTFPYLQITNREDYPRVMITRTPKESGTLLFGPFPSASLLRGTLQVLQKIFKFRTCTLNIKEGDDRWECYRPCILASIGQCSAPCHFGIPREIYRRNIRRLKEFLNGDRKKVLRDLHNEMKDAAEERRYERAAELRDQIQSLEKLKERGNLERDVQPEAFQIDPRRGVLALKKLLKLEEIPRLIEGVDIAHLGGEDTVASLVRFQDGLPFKNGYRRYKIRSVSGIDDFASIAEVVARRFAIEDPNNPPPDILLIDGGKGQLHAACRALETAKVKPKVILSLAKRDEEIFLPDQEEPIRLSRHSFALRLLQYVRDESHRFAQHYHHLLRKKSTFGDS